MRIHMLVIAVAVAAARLLGADAGLVAVRLRRTVVTAIEVDPHPPAMVGDEPSAWRRAVKYAVFQSSTTREGTVRSFLRARVGDHCSDRWWARWHGYSARSPTSRRSGCATVPDGADGVRVIVETIDEVPLISAAATAKAGSPTSSTGTRTLRGRGSRPPPAWRDGRSSGMGSRSRYDSTGCSTARSSPRSTSFAIRSAGRSPQASRNRSSAICSTLRGTPAARRTRHTAGSFAVALRISRFPSLEMCGPWAASRGIRGGVRAC